jgi:hypothetical protein
MINGQSLEEEVNEPKHYRSHESGIEAIEITRWLQFDLGNCWKYCMRYRDKGTPKKDLMKALWYINDFRKFFIDYNNDSTFIHKIPEDIIEKMIKVTETDPVAEVRAMFELIIMISTQNGVIDPKIIDTTIYGLEQFSKTFKD